MSLAETLLDPKERLSELEEVYKNVTKAADLIDKAKIQYIKRQIAARNKKQVAEQEEFYADVKDFQRIDDIRDLYGWGIISDDEMHHLIDKWEAYQTAKKQNNQYKDAVTEMMDMAASHLYEKYSEELDEYKTLKKEIDEAQRSHRWTHRGR